MSFKRDNKKLKNIILVAAFFVIAACYIFVNTLPEKVRVEEITEGYKLNAKF